MEDEIGILLFVDSSRSFRSSASLTAKTENNLDALGGATERLVRFLVPDRFFNKSFLSLSISSHFKISSSIG